MSNLPTQVAAPQQMQAPFQSASLYVGDLHPEVTEAFLFDMFNKVGPVASIRVCRDVVTRRSLGYAYVNFHHVDDAERALDTMNYSDIKGRACRIMWSQRDPSLRKSGLGNVYVKNLAASVDHKGLIDIFSVFGNILSCKVASDPETGLSKGYGYVHYETAEAANDAITKLNGLMIEDKEVSVQLFLPPGSAQRSSAQTWSNLYVKQYPEDWTESNLEETFSPFGKINSIYMPRDENGKAKGFAFVDYYNLAAPEAAHASAEAALAALHLNMNFPKQKEEDPERVLYVAKWIKKEFFARSKMQSKEARKGENIKRSQGMNLYVKNFDDTVTDEMLLDMFSRFGTISKGVVKRDNNGASRGFGFVCYINQEAAAKAISEMNGFYLNGKPLYVALYQTREQRLEYLRRRFAARAGGIMPGVPFGIGAPFAAQRFPMQMAPMNMPYMMGGNRNRQPNFRYPQQFGQPQYNMPQYNQQGQPNFPQQGNRQAGGRGGQQNQQRNMRPNQGQASGRGGAARNQPGGRGPSGQQVQFTNAARNTSQRPAANNAGNSAVDLPPLDHLTLAQADLQTQKNMIGERLYPLIVMKHPDLAGKITGMLLEMDNAELLHLLESPEALDSKTEEALQVLNTHMQANNSTQ